MLENVRVLCQSCVRIERDKVIYFDPFRVDREYHDADIILITHDHFDHFSPEDIAKVQKENTCYVAPEKMKKEASKLGVPEEQIFLVKPGEQYTVDGVSFETVPSYNKLKPFHPKSAGWVGYIITINNMCYYVPGDMDATKESKEVKCDVAFLPIGGTYTMAYKEAAELANTIRPKCVVPFHYGGVVGQKEDGERFRELLDPGIQCELLIERFGD
ncbi:MAG: MBL fold metallo-hydrolase [Acetatifactor sp.]|nr:MBL fold metallo-hydrolase [Acetatifactor sp.]